MYSEDVEDNTYLKLRAFMRANFIALDSRVDGAASISWKLLNTFRLLILVCTAALVKWLPHWVTNRNGIVFRMSFRNVVPFKNAHTVLAPKPEFTDKLTPVTEHSPLKKCMHKTLTQQKLLTPSEYRSTGRIG